MGTYDYNFFTYFFGHYFLTLKVELCVEMCFTITALAEIYKFCAIALQQNGKRKENWDSKIVSSECDEKKQLKLQETMTELNAYLIISGICGGLPSKFVNNHFSQNQFSAPNQNFRRFIKAIGVPRKTFENYHYIFPTWI